MVQYFYHEQHGIEAAVGIGGIDLAGRQELEILSWCFWYGYSYACSLL